MSLRLALPHRRNHATQKVLIAGQHTLYLSVHDDAQPAEIFLRLKDWDCSSELIALYDVIARLVSLALQYGDPLEQVGDLLAGAQFAPCGRCPGTIASSRARVCRILVHGISWLKTADERRWRISAPHHDV
jgi:hypothetical protein